MRLLFLLIASLTITACKKSQDKESLFWVKYNLQLSTTDTIRLSVSTYLNGDTAKLTYKSAFDTVTYILRPTKPELSKFIAPYEGSDNFNFVHDTTIIIGSKSIKVLRFKMSTGAMDSGSEHYWTPNFGVFMVHSSTWPDIWILQSQDEFNNKTILQLVKATCPSFFIEGKLKEQIAEK